MPRPSKQEELEFLTNPLLWPMIHILPVVAKGDVPESRADGFVHISNLHRVYFSNIYSIRKKMENHQELEFKDFPSPEALLDEYRID